MASPAPLFLLVLPRNQEEPRRLYAVLPREYPGSACSKSYQKELSPEEAKDFERRHPQFRLQEI